MLRGGTLLGGTGRPGATCDIAVTGGSIVEIRGGGGRHGDREFDVSSAVVCPGFIDLHSHADFTVYTAPDAPTPGGDMAGS